MIHQPSGGSNGQATDIQIQAEHIISTKEKLNKILSENTGQPIEKVIKDCERDYFMSAQESEDYGLVDLIIDRKNERK